MFDIDDLAYLFKNGKVESKDIYKQDVSKHQQVAKKIIAHNSNFSETLFTSWVSNMFLRCIYYCSGKDNEKLLRFKKNHFYDSNINLQNLINLYNEYRDISIKFIDFLDFVHTEDNDTITIKLCLSCSSEEENEPYFFYYTLELRKQNDYNKEQGSKSNYTSNCPNCGAPTNITTFGICAHCQEMVSIYDNVWKIIKIELDK
ncbi:MAG: hypothetical protein IKI57_05370 [Clostridia bacterium]|nr:hypothetical protein [Clostridia bacterium]